MIAAFLLVKYFVKGDILMGLFDLFEDARDNVEKAQRAREYRQRAKELVREGEDLYERAFERTIRLARKVEEELKQHIAFKREIGNELECDVNSTLSQFAAFNIDSRIERTTEIIVSDLGMKMFASATDNYIINPQIPSILDSFFSTEDYYEAKRQRDEARKYKEQMKLEKEKLYVYKDRMETISAFIKNERAELETLMKKVRLMTEKLKSCMSQEKFSTEEAQQLKGLQQITEGIVSLLSADFLAKDFGINQSYIDSYEKIKSINSNLPDTPDLSNVNFANVIPVVY